MSVVNFPGVVPLKAAAGSATHGILPRHDRGGTFQVLNL